MPNPTITLSMSIGNQILDETSDVILDETGEDIRDEAYVANTDVMVQPAPVLKQGMSSIAPLSFVADPGMFTFALQNSANNSAGLAGYYSPDHANALTGFDVGLKVLLKMEGSNTYYQLYRIIDIKPIPGKNGPRYTQVIAADYMNEFLKNKISLLPAQTDQRDDQLIATLVADMPFAPAATDYAVGSDTYTYALHDERDEVSTMMRVLQKIAQSGLGRFFVTGDQTVGETLVYQSRQSRLTNLSPVATLNDTMTGLDISRPEAKKVSRVEATAYPASVDASAVVLSNLSFEISLAAGASVTREFRYRDPNQEAARVSGKDMVTPVADTDYKFSSVSGSGNDLNASLGVSVTFGANTASVTFTNNHATSTGFLHFFQLRGKGLYLYNPIKSIASEAGGTGETLRLEMFYQDDPNVAQDVATVMLNWYKDVATEVRQVEFVANSSQTLLDYAIEVQVGDAVSIQETQSGINATYFVNQKEWRFDEDKYYFICRWTLVPAQQASFFILDDSTYGVLDTSQLGF